MTTEQALLAFSLGFLRAAVLTFTIQALMYWGYCVSVFLIVGIVGGIMTMKREENSK